jgi:hypothetical protein
MKKPVKKLVIKTIVWFVGGVLLSAILQHAHPMITADTAVKQLEDSDSAYLQFKAVMGIGSTFILAGYTVIALFFLHFDIKKLFKGDK